MCIRDRFSNVARTETFTNLFGDDITRTINLAPDLTIDFADVEINDEKIRASLSDISATVGEFLEGDQFQDSLGAFVTLTDGISSLFQAQIEGYEALADQRQEQIDQLETDLNREQELYEAGLANNVGAKQDELNQLLAEQEEFNRQADELRRRQIQAETAATLAQTAAQGTLAVANAFTAHSSIPFIGVAIAAGFAATILAQIKTARTQLQSLHTGTDRLGDHFGTIAPGGATDRNHGGQGAYGIYKMRGGNAISDTGIRVGGNERLVTEETNRNFGDIIDHVERNPSHADMIRQMLDGQGTSFNQAADSASQYNITNISNGMSKEDLKEVMREVLAEQTSDQIEYDKAKPRTLVIPPGAKMIERSGKKSRSK